MNIWNYRREFIHIWRCCFTFCGLSLALPAWPRCQSQGWTQENLQVFEEWWMPLELKWMQLSPKWWTAFCLLPQTQRNVLCTWHLTTAGLQIDVFHPDWQRPRNINNLCELSNTLYFLIFPNLWSLKADLSTFWPCQTNLAMDYNEHNFFNIFNGVSGNDKPWPHDDYWEQILSTAFSCTPGNSLRSREAMKLSPGVGSIWPLHNNVVTD